VIAIVATVAKQERIRISDRVRAPKNEYRKNPASQIQQTRIQIDKSKQSLAYLESLLSQYLAFPGQTFGDFQKQLQNLRDHMKTQIPPEHPPSPRLKKSA